MLISIEDILRLTKRRALSTLTEQADETFSQHHRETMNKLYPNPNPIPRGFIPRIITVL